MTGSRDQGVPRQGHRRRDDPDRRGRRGRRRHRQLRAVHRRGRGTAHHGQIQLPDKALYTTEGVLDEGTYAADITGAQGGRRQLHRRGDRRAWRPPIRILDFQRDRSVTGPFKFVEFKPGESIEYAANAEYFLAPRQIQQLLHPDHQGRHRGRPGARGRSGRLEVFARPGRTYDEIKDDPNLKFVEYPDFGFFALYFNHRERPALPDKNLRQAVSYASTRKPRRRGHGAARVSPIYSEIPPASWAYPTEGLNKYPMDPAKSKALIEAPGWALGVRRHLREGRPEAVHRRRRPRRVGRTAPSGCSCWRPGQGVRHRPPVQGDRLRGHPEHAGRVTRISTQRPRRPASRSMPTSVGSDGPRPRSVQPVPLEPVLDGRAAGTFNYDCYQSDAADKLIEEGLVDLRSGRAGHDLPGVRGHPVE